MGLHPALLHTDALVLFWDCRDVMENEDERAEEFGWQDTRPPFLKSISPSRFHGYLRYVHLVVAKFFLQSRMMIRR